MATEIKDVTKFFGDFQALYDINLTIEQGEFIAILGPSGCGKTTLLRLISGFGGVTSGEIKIDDQVVSNSSITLPPEERNISMVFQNFALWPHMTISEHIKFPLDYDQFADDSLTNNKEKRIKEVLKTINLEDRAQSYPSELSGGQKQRVALGRAIATEPSILLMDEPLSALDAELRIEMRREIQELHRLTKASIIYVTHDQGEALAMADRIVVMNKGHIEQVGTPHDIYYYPHTSFVAQFVSKANLFSGTWQDGVFHFADSTVFWSNVGTTPEMQLKNLYALRPEQIELSDAHDNHLTAEIVSKQFQGKEMHYVIKYKDQMINVMTSFDEQFDIGQTISFSPKM